MSMVAFPSQQDDNGRSVKQDGCLHGDLEKLLEDTKRHSPE